MINFLDKLIPLLLGHFVADFAIQTDTVALNKCPKNKSKISWVWWMTGHVSIHGLIVYFFCLKLEELKRFSSVPVIPQPERTKV